MTEKNNETVEAEFSDIEELNALGQTLTNVVNESKLDVANVSTLLLGIALGYARAANMPKADFLKYATDIWEFTEEVTKEVPDEKPDNAATAHEPVEEKGSENKSEPQAPSDQIKPEESKEETAKETK